MISVSSFGNAAAAMADLLLFMKILRTLQFLYMNVLRWILSFLRFFLTWDGMIQMVIVKCL